MPRRWAHVQGVAGRAAELAEHPDLDGDNLVASAWLHDIGYAPDLIDTGFHPIDGARLLRRHRFDDRIVCLVAHHSCARREAALRDLLDVLEREFAREDSPTADALWYCDLTIGPDGSPTIAADRLAEIRSRYGPDHVVTQFVDLAEEELLAAVRRTTERLTQYERLTRGGSERAEHT